MCCEESSFFPCNDGRQGMRGVIKLGRAQGSAGGPGPVRRDFKAHSWFWTMFMSPAEARFPSCVGSVPESIPISPRQSPLSIQFATLDRDPSWVGSMPLIIVDVMASSPSVLKRPSWLGNCGDRQVSRHRRSSIGSNARWHRGCEQVETAYSTTALTPWRGAPCH